MKRRPIFEYLSTSSQSFNSVGNVAQLTTDLLVISLNLSLLRLPDASSLIPAIRGYEGGLPTAYQLFSLTSASNLNLNGILLHRPTDMYTICTAASMKLNQAFGIV